VAQGEGPEFKPQYCKEKERERETLRLKKREEVQAAGWHKLVFLLMKTKSTVISRISLLHPFVFFVYPLS
jgi:hypothetical protein